MTRVTTRGGAGGTPTAVAASRRCSHCWHVSRMIRRGMKRLSSLAVLLAANESPRPMKPRAPETVMIYRTKSPEGEYVEVADLGDVGDDEAEALQKLELSAAGVGCDGLIVGTARAASMAQHLGGSHVSAVEFSGTCIMFAQDPGTWRPSPLDARCAADRERLFAAKPEERAAIARSMPIDCHR